MTPAELCRHIERLAAVTEERGRLLAWLDDYGTPGYYGRRGLNHSAAFAYNHLQNAPWLLVIAEAAGTPPFALRKAKKALRQAPRNLGSQAAAVREVLPWALVEALFNARGE